VVLHQAGDFVGQMCAQFAASPTVQPDEQVLERAQTAVYNTLSWWLESPVVVSPLCDGLLTLARARSGQAGLLAALQRARTRLEQAAFYVPLHLAEPEPEIPS
jgi:hypothetical protein